MNITYAEMQSAATRLSNGESNIDTELAALKSLVDQLVSEGFVTDSASGAFQAAYGEFNSGASKVIAGLSQMSAYLNKAATTYQDADQSLARAIQQ
jgi:WXG100 family type VII secretion target